MRLSVPEILELVAQAKTKDDKIEVLHKHDNPVLRDILRINFEHTVNFDLPKGPAPFNTDRTIADNTLTTSNLYNEHRRLYIFEPGHPKYNPNVKRVQKENIWIQILEGCHWTEADMLNIVKDKELQKHYKGLTEALVRDAFPTLLSPKPEEKS